MTLDAAALLAGPRGRRLCLQFALAAGVDDTADELRSAAFYAAYDLDPGRGRSRVLFGPETGSHTPGPHPAEVAALLDAATIAPPSETQLWFALREAVDAARYWQEPDGEDALAGSPPMRESLARVARLLADSPHADWWTSPLDDTQWAVFFVDNQDLGPAAAPAAVSEVDTLERWQGAQRHEETLAGLRRPMTVTAAISGSWWSKPPWVLTQSARALNDRGPVGLQLVEDRFSWTAAAVERLVVPGGARIYEIDGPAAWAQLCTRYPMDVTSSRRHDWFRATGRTGRWMLPNWARVSADVDAVHLTVAGYLTTAGLAVPVGDDAASVLAGWNPDQTYWLGEVTRDVSTRQQWTEHDDSSGWARSPEP